MSSENVAGCLWYAQRLGYSLQKGNVMVEGNTDVAYFQLSDRLYSKAFGIHLIGKDLSIFAAGSGDEGGTYGIIDKFPTLHELARLDVDQNGKLKFRVIALMDDDYEGRKAVRVIEGSRRLRENGQIFLLRRRMPRKSRDRVPLGVHVREENQIFGGAMCVIEDLVNSTLADIYFEKNEHHVLHTVEVGGVRRRIWSEDGKHGLFKFVSANAELDEMVMFIEVLKSLRFYLGLPPDGVK
jgi:hypothetical protein